MMNHSVSPLMPMSTQDMPTLPTIAPDLAPLPHVELPPIPLDPTNPLIWVVMLILLLSHTDDLINAVANLVQVITPLIHRPSPQPKNRKSKR